MTIPSSYLDAPVEVRTYQGEGAYGPTYGQPVTVAANLDARRRLVRTASGDEVVAEMTLRLDPDPALDVEQLLQPESRVSVRGRDARVITVHPHLDRGLLAYLEVTTT